MQILINIIGNAFKFTEKGFVRLTVTGERKKDNLYTIIFVIEDTGCGIDEEIKESIFEPFKSFSMSNNKIEGTGLGLSICKNLVNLMDGTIEVDNREEGGAVFKVTFFNIKSDSINETLKFNEDIKKDEVFRDKLLQDIDIDQLIEIRNIFLKYNKVINISQLIEDINIFLKNKEDNEKVRELCEKILFACKNYDFLELERINKIIEKFLTKRSSHAL